jgi:hypothetical protein
MEGVKEIVKDPSWQKVRQNLIGNWKERPNWCVAQLRKYIGSVHSADEKKLKLVLNYLTGSGFRSGAISSRDNPSIPKLRAEISAELKKRKFKHEQLQPVLFGRNS